MSSLTDAQMREALKKAYPGRKWKLKVNKMSEHEVVAIYLRFKAQAKV